MRPFTVASLALVSLCGCMSSVARSRAANEFGCPESQVDVTSLGSNGWDASGCGQEAVFVCSSDGDRNLLPGEDFTTCVREGEIHDTDPPQAPPLPVAPSTPSGTTSTTAGAKPFDREAARAVARRTVIDADSQCRNQSGPHGAGRAVITLSNDGHVDSVSLDSRFDASGTGACLTDRLRAMTVPAFAGGPFTVHVHFFLQPASS
jgi:hypothetical protein